MDRIKSLAGKYSVLILVLVILFQVCTLVYMGFVKTGYHIDEIYSYILSNSYDTDRISNSDEVNNKWTSGEKFRDFVSVQEGERFAYDKTYYNNTKDAHPPFYYFLLHTVSSFFVNKFSKWFGLGINIFLFILNQIFLYILSSKVLKSSLWGLIPVVSFGGMMLCFDTVLFIRMYMLITLLTVLLIFVHCKMLDGSLKFPYLWCFLLTFIGTFTHYYFAVVAFYVAVSYLIYLLSEKKVKSILAYGASMLSAVLCVLLVYPASITQITGSDTNNIGNEVSGNIFNFQALPFRLFKVVGKIIKSFIPYNNKILIFMLISVALVLLSAFLFRKRDKTVCKINKTEIKQLLVLCLIIIFSVVTVFHFSGKFSYLRYIYNLVPIGVLAVVWILKAVLNYVPFNKNIIAIGVAFLFFVYSAEIVLDNRSSYLFKEMKIQNDEVIELCENRPLIVINNETNYFPTSKFLLLSACENIYISDTSKIDADKILKGKVTDNGAVFLILTDKEWSNGYDGDKVMKKIVKNSSIFSKYKNTDITISFSQVYIAN